MSRIVDQYPLIPTQQGMLFNRLSDPQSAVDMVQVICRLPGALDRAALRRAWQTVLERHTALRSGLDCADPQRATQQVHEGLALDWRELDGVDIAREEWLMADRARGVALAEPPLFRLTLARSAPDAHTLVWTLHHAIADARAFAIIFRELNSCYTAALRGAAAPLPPARPYREVVEWLAGQEPDAGRAAGYWQRELAGAVAATRLGLPQPDSAAGAPALAGVHRQLRAELPEDVTHRLLRFSHESGVGMATIVQGAWALLLSRYSGEADVLLAASRTLRGAGLPASDEIVGMLLATIPLRVQVPRGVPVSEWLRASQRAQWEMLRSRAWLWPLARILREAGAPREAGEFESLVIFDNRPVEETLRMLGDLWREAEFGFRIQTNYPLTVCAFLTRTLLIDLVYDPQRFARDAVQRLGAQLCAVLAGIADRPECLVEQLPCMPEQERAWLLRLGDGGPPAPAARVSVGEQLSAQCRRSPERCALRCGERVMCYAELDALTEQIARGLARVGVQRGDRVGVLLGRRVELVAALAAIWRVGACYVPLDVALPPARIAAMLDDSAARFVLSEEALRSALPAGARVLLLDDLLLDEPGAGVPQERPRESLDELAYVIYTSGSTGTPKGIAVSHGNLTAFFAGFSEAVGFRPDDVLVSVTTLTFDISLLDLFGPLLCGACVVIAPRETGLDGRALGGLLEREGATILQATPVTWQILMDAGWRGKRDLRAWSGGEALRQDLLTRLLGCCAEVWNLYGPSETTVWCTAQRMRPGDRPRLIGRPLPGVRAVVLDPQQGLLPLGALGELCIGGAGVCPGYASRADLTAARFVADPFADEPSARMYRSGDRARVRADGVLEYCGRDDAQIKLRGHRIELSEIEAALLQFRDVAECAVILHERAGHAFLAAYVRLRGGSAGLDESGLREHLRARLPEYMVPVAILALGSIPRLPSGKLDRAALPAPSSAQLSAAPRTPPRDELERRLAEIWEQTLGAQSVGIHDDFFDVGGDSLLALGLYAEIERRLGRKIPLGALLSAPTIAAMAQHLRAPEAQTAPACLVPIQPHGARTPLFGVHGASGHVLPYRAIAAALGADQPLYAFQAQGIDGREAPLARIEDMAERYVDELRRVQPRGPYRLCGACFGTLVALEMALRLRAAGESIELLCMIDGWAPGWPRWAANRTPLPGPLYRLLRRGAAALRPILRAKGGGRIAALRARTALATRLTLHMLRERSVASSAMRAVQRALRVARDGYAARRYDGPLVLLRARERRADYAEEATLGWSGVARGGVRTREIGGHHLELYRPPQLALLAQYLGEELDGARIDPTAAPSMEVGAPPAAVRDW